MGDVQQDGYDKTLLQSKLTKIVELILQEEQ
jgi:hypothetical protein